MDKVIVHSHQAVKELKNMYDYPLEKKAHIIFHGNYNGCYPKPSQSKEELRKRFLIPKTCTSVLYFGSIKPYKGIEKLIEAFSDISDSSNELELLIVGGCYDTSYREKLINISNNNKKIKFGYVENQDLIDYLCALDLVALPFSDTLTSGSTILAMTCGRALILPETAKVFGCVPHEGALYFNEPEELIYILKNIQDYNLRQMGEVNAIHAARMSWDRVGKSTLDVYSS